MSKYAYIDNFIRLLVKMRWGNNTLLGKHYKNTPYILYYNPVEHLTFLGQKKISYSFEVQNKITKYISDGNLVFDIGANIGQYALFFSILVGKKGKVISVEPDSDNFAILSLNKYKNNCSNLVLLNVGLDHVKRVQTLFKDKLTGGRKSSFLKEFTSLKYEQQNVNTITLCELIQQFGIPQFIKIDIEGYENEIVSKLTEQIFNKPITWLIEVRESSKEACFKRFSSTHICYLLDFKISKEMHKATDIPAFANLLFIPISDGK